MTPEQIERKRERQRLENMTPEQIERRRRRMRELRRIENMTPEQIERARQRQRHRRADRAAYTRAFMALLAGLPDACALCGSVDNLVLDHEHGFGPRGVLCHGCNITLGRIEKGRPGDRGAGWVARARAYLADPPFYRALRERHPPADP